MEMVMKPFGWISVIYMLDENGNREGVFKRSRFQLTEEDAQRCAREWEASWRQNLMHPERYEFTAEQMFAA